MNTCTCYELLKLIGRATKLCSHQGLEKLLLMKSEPSFQVALGMIYVGLALACDVENAVSVQVEIHLWQRAVTTASKSCSCHALGTAEAT